MSSFKFFVPGIPQPGGSKKGFAYFDKNQGKYRAVVTEDNKKSKPWREAVAWAAKEVFGEPLQGPLQVEFKFIMPRPKGHFGKRGLLPSAPKLPSVKPDVTKLIRSTEDAMKGIAWIDDSMIVNQHGQKVYGRRPGALITIELATADPEEEMKIDQALDQLGLRACGMGG
jgi:Holliday junction resolvase RusA-like endonuclease